MKVTIFVALLFVAVASGERSPLANLKLAAIQRDQTTCEICKFGVTVLKNVLDEVIDREAILEQALAACNSFPEDLQQDCRDLQESQLNIVFKTIDRWVTEEVICNNWLGVCGQ